MTAQAPQKINATKPLYQTVWITGASSGIGLALAQLLARSGSTVAISARSAEKLADAAAKNYGSGKLIAYPLDITDQAAVETTVQKIDADLGGVDLAILNAGTYTPEMPGTFDIKQIEDQFRTNVFGTTYSLGAILPLMKNRPGAHIAVVASVAGYRGLPRAIGYGGTKAALINMTEAMKLDCDAAGIKLQLICPGFVKTQLTDKNEFPMPFLISTDEAAQSIMRGLASKQFEIVFPRPMAIGMKLLQLLPYRLLFPLLRRATGAG
jgi:short-subunit dehydrogenase